MSNARMSTLSPISVFEMFSFKSNNFFHYIILLPVVLALVSGFSVITFSLIEKPFIFIQNRKVTSLD